MSRSTIAWLILTTLVALAIIFMALVPEDHPILDRGSWGPAGASRAILAEMSNWEFADDEFYTPILLPRDAIICAPADSTFKCMAVPDGTIVLFPVPQAAPVDSL